MIGIIGAMEEEVNAIKQYMELKETKHILDFQYDIGTIHQKEVVLLQCGIGKVNAAICTTLLLTQFDIDYVINIGSAGGLSLDQEIGDIVISRDIQYYDVDVTGFEYPMGQVPGMPQVFQADPLLIDHTIKTLQKLNLRYHIGTIASGDQFVCNKSQVKQIKHVIKDAICCEMEAGAIVQTCYKFHTNFIITRSLSDVFDKGDSSIQFDEYLKKASENSAKMCVSLIQEVI